jgi:hypothetical protein
MTKLNTVKDLLARFFAALRMTKCCVQNDKGGPIPKLFSYVAAPFRGRLFNDKPHTYLHAWRRAGHMRRRGRAHISDITYTVYSGCLSLKTGRSGEKMRSELEQIPGIGKNMARHLIAAGISTIESLKGRDPKEIYLRDCAAQGCEVDRCALYAYRLAVHYDDHDGQLPSDKQNWWDWKG